MKKILATLLIGIVATSNIFFVGGDVAMAAPNTDGSQIQGDTNTSPSTNNTDGNATAASSQTDGGQTQSNSASPNNTIPDTKTTNAIKNANIKELCTWSPLSWSLTGCVSRLIFSIAGIIVFVAGTFLNLAIKVSVFYMSAIVNNTGAINAAWKVFRDLCNIFFIFILIYLSIRTILKSWTPDIRKSIAQVIIIALVINFSMYFTKFMIDASNILTVQFYNSITVGNSDFDNGLSWVFMNASHLTSVFPDPNDPTAIGSGSQVFSNDNVFTIAFMSLIFSIVLAFAFLLIGCLFIIRLGVLIFLIILSPFAFISTTIPGTKLGSAWNDWWKALLDQVIFAPTMMAMLWVVAAIERSRDFVNAVHGGQSGLNDNFAMVFGASSFGSGFTQSLFVVVNFAILIVLLIGGVHIAKKFSFNSASGLVTSAYKFSGKVVGAGTFSAAGFAGRTLIGGGANALANMGWLQKKTGEGSRMATRATLALKGLSKNSFDARGTSFAGGLAGQLGTSFGTPQKGGYVEQAKQTRDFVTKFKGLDEGTRKFQDENKRKAQVKEDEDIINSRSVDEEAKKAAKDRLKSNLGKFSEEEILEMASGWKNLTLGNKLGEKSAIIMALSPEQINNIKKKAGYSENDTKQLTTIREKDLRDKLENIKNNSKDKENLIKDIQKISDKEFEILSNDILALREFSTNLTRKQVKSLLSNDKISSEGKDGLKKSRQEYVKELLPMQTDTNGILVDTDSTNKLKGMVQTLTGDEISRLDLADMKTRDGYNVFINNITPDQLTKAAENMSPNDINTLRNDILEESEKQGNNAKGQLKATAKWLDSGPGRQLFS